MAVFKKYGEWYIDYYYNGRRRREKIGASKKLALAVDGKRRVEIAEGKFLDKKNKNDITFKEMAQLFMVNHSMLTKRSWKEDEYMINAQLSPFFGNLKLSQINPLDIERFKAKRFESNRAPQTVKHEVNLISVIFNKAIKWQKFSGPNPVAATEKIKVYNERLRFLSIEEIDKLYRTCDSEQLFAKYSPLSKAAREFTRKELKNLITLAINTGLRRGELENLVWQDVDIRQELLHVRKAKSRAGIRAIPMTNAAKKTILSIRKLPESENIFSSSHEVLYKNLLRLAKIKDANFHTLRHTFASHFIMAGGQLLTLSKLLGHSDIKMTMRYAHLAPNHMTKESNCLAD